MTTAIEVRVRRPTRDIQRRIAPSPPLLADMLVETTSQPPNDFLECGADFPGEIYPRVVWHREDPSTRYQGFQQMLEITDPVNGSVEYIDGFVIPEVGDVDDWEKADKFFTIVENEHGFEKGSLSMSVIDESGEAELALNDLREEMGKPSNNLERLFLLVNGEVDYTKDMRAMTPTGELPPWPELRHNISRYASAAGMIAVDGPYDDIRDVEGYNERNAENREKSMIGIWLLTPGQVVEADETPLPPETGRWLLEIGDREIELEEEDGRQVYTGHELELEAIGDGQYVLRDGGDEYRLDEDGLREDLLYMTAYVPGMDDIVDSMEEFEAAKEAGKGAMTQSTTLIIDSVKIESRKIECGTRLPIKPTRRRLPCFRMYMKTGQTNRRTRGNVRRRYRLTRHECR